MIHFYEDEFFIGVVTKQCGVAVHFDQQSVRGRGGGLLPFTRYILTKMGEPLSFARCILTKMGGNLSFDRHILTEIGDLFSFTGPLVNLSDTQASLRLDFEHPAICVVLC